MLFETDPGPQGDRPGNYRKIHLTGPYREDELNYLPASSASAILNQALRDSLIKLDGMRHYQGAHAAPFAERSGFGLCVCV